MNKEKMAEIDFRIRNALMELAHAEVAARDCGATNALEYLAADCATLSATRNLLRLIGLENGSE